jgi:hypothetical protein
MNRTSNKNKIPEEALKLLPWYATGWLSPEERSYLKEMMEKFPELRKLLATEREVIRLVKEDESLLDQSSLESTNSRLEKVLKKLESENTTQDTKTNSLVSKLNQFIHAFLSGSSSKTQYAAFAAITTLTIALLFAFISPLVKQNNVFHPATMETPVRADTKNVTIILVGLNASPSDPALLKVLKGFNGQIDAVQGKDGMYRISLSKKLNSDQTHDLIKQLSSYKELFWFAGEAY